MANLTTAKAITFLDIETTHLDPSRSAVLSISIVTDWDNGQQDVWTTKIKPASTELEYASEEALKVCNYSAEEWKDAPSFSEVAETIAKKLRYGPLIAHNINFDISHLMASFKRRGWEEVKPDGTVSYVPDQDGGNGITQAYVQDLYFKQPIGTEVTQVTQVTQVTPVAQETQET